jgi:hypothetical protein
VIDVASRLQLQLSAVNAWGISSFRHLLPTYGILKAQILQAASTYAPYEEARGGPHAFYNQTYQQDTPRIMGEVEKLLLGALP